MTVFLGCPTHDGRLESGTATAIRNASKKHSIVESINRSSLLAYNCNNLWCMALNMRKNYGLKYFAMLHSDIVPENYWLDKLIDLAEEHEADLMSAVVPIKDESGDISIAVGQPYYYKRMNINQLDKLTFDYVGQKSTKEPCSCRSVLMVNECALECDYQEAYKNKFVVNTGCMVVRIDKPWSDKVWFEINDKITFQKGQWVASVEPEDWFFSRKVAEFGGKVMATKSIYLEHVGTKRYSL